MQKAPRCFLPGADRHQPNTEITTSHPHAEKRSAGLPGKAKKWRKRVRWLPTSQDHPHALPQLSRESRNVLTQGCWVKCGQQPKSELVQQLGFHFSLVFLQPSPGESKWQPAPRPGSAQRWVNAPTLLGAEVQLSREAAAFILCKIWSL